MDFSKVDKYGLTHDLIKVALFNILAQLAMSFQYKDVALDGKFVFQLLFVLAGFALFYLFVEPHIKQYWTNPETKKYWAKK
jgi:hypothetical protein